MLRWMAMGARLEGAMEEPAVKRLGLDWEIELAQVQARSQGALIDIDKYRAIVRLDEKPAYRGGKQPIYLGLQLYNDRTFMLNNAKAFEWGESSFINMTRGMNFDGGWVAGGSLHDGAVSWGAWSFGSFDRNLLGDDWALYGILVNDFRGIDWRVGSRLKVMLVLMSGPWGEIVSMGNIERISHGGPYSVISLNNYVDTARFLKEMSAIPLSFEQAQQLSVELFPGAVQTARVTKTSVYRDALMKNFAANHQTAYGWFLAVAELIDRGTAWGKIDLSERFFYSLGAEAESLRREAVRCLEKFRLKAEVKHDHD